MSQQDRHLVTEQLSAFLDQQLTPEEQAYCSAHLAECKQCQDVLDDLRQTANLLRSLPQLEVPRSFALPTAFKIIQSTPNEDKQRQVEQTLETSPHKLPTPLRRTLRAASVLVAVIGLFFALSGFVAILQPNPSAMSSMPMANPAHSFTPSQTQPPIGATSQISKGSSNSDDSSASSNRAGEKQPTPVVKRNTTTMATGSTVPLLDFSLPGVRLSFGLLLAIVGSIGFLLFVQRQKQRKRSARRNL